MVSSSTAQDFLTRARRSDGDRVQLKPAGPPRESGNLPICRMDHRIGVTSCRRLVSLLALLGAALAAASCRGDAPRARTPAVVWRTLGSWSGHGSMQTEPFISDTGSLRLRWETRNEAAPGTGIFRVTVHSDVSGRPLILARRRARRGQRDRPTSPRIRGRSSSPWSRPTSTGPSRPKKRSRRRRAIRPRHSRPERASDRRVENRRPIGRIFAAIP